MAIKTKIYSLMMGALCLALLVASCRRLPVAPPTGIPSITPTPRSTALPPIPTDVPLATDKNPLRLTFVALESSDAQSSDSSTTDEAPTAPNPNNAAGDLEQALHDATQMSVRVNVVNSDAEALAALCASPQGTVSAAWMSGLAYVAAFAQGCGSAALQVERGEQNSAGDQARIITNSADISGLADLKDKTFCRLGYTDIYSWLIPSLMIHSTGVADSDMKAIKDYTDARTMVDDVAAGGCDAAGISGNQLDGMTGARNSVHTVQQSATIPYAVLVVPAELPLAQQQQLSNALIAIGNGTRADTLKALLNQDQIVAATDDDLSALRSFVNGTGINLAQAGN